MTFTIIHDKRVGKRNVDYREKFVPLGNFCEERDEMDNLSVCDFFNRTTRNCNLHGVELKFGSDISHGLMPRMLAKKCSVCLSETMDFSDVVGAFD